MVVREHLMLYKDLTMLFGMLVVAVEVQVIFMLVMVAKVAAVMAQDSMVMAKMVLKGLVQVEEQLEIFLILPVMVVVESL